MASPTRTMTTTSAGSPGAPIDPLALRAQFPILADPALVYLDSGASSQKPASVISAIERYYREDNANVHRGVYQLAERSTEAYEQARRSVARFFGVANDQQIVFTRNTTEAINLVARSWADANLQPGDVILLTEMEHHSNLVPWQLAAARTGARLEFIRLTSEGLLDLDTLDQWLATGSVRLVAFPHVSNMLGTVNPAQEIIQRAHAANAVVLIDGAQSAPHLTLHLDTLGADFYACSAHKMYGPMGAGMLFGRWELLSAMPPFLGGGDMIRDVELRSSTWADPPARFEAGTPSVADAVGFGAACDFLAAIGMQQVQAHTHDLTRYLWERLREEPGIDIYGPTPEHRSGLVTFNLGDVHAHDVASILDEQHICIRAGHHCTQPLHGQLDLAASARASVSIHTTHADIDRLIDGLRRAKQVFS